MTNFPDGRDEPSTATTASAGHSTARTRLVFWCTTILVALLDVVTKEWARNELVPEFVSRPLLGDVLRLTLLYNPGAAFGLHVGEHSRWFFMVLTIVAVVVLVQLYRGTRANDAARVLAIGLVMGGAIGNLVNRIWSTRGVVDFLDVGIGSHRWPAFNVADIGVSVGAALLAWSLWREGRAANGAESAP